MMIFQNRIFRVDLRANRKVLYLFGDNDARIGEGGQAKEMRGEPNAVGIRTKKYPMMGSKNFYTDDEYSDNVQKIEEDFVKVKAYLLKGGVVVCPMDGLGTGMAQLRERAPRTYLYLVDTITVLRG